MPRPVGIKLGKYLLPSNVLVPALMAFLFVLITVAAALEGGFDALLLRLTGFVLFVVLAYSVRARLKPMRFYTKLIDAFAVLFGTQILWSAVEYFNVYNSASRAPTAAVVVAVANGLVSSILIAGLLAYEKDKPEKVFGKVKKIGAGLKIGVPALVAGATLSLILNYQFFSGGKPDVESLLWATGWLTVFAIATGVAGEAWFRGLFLFRLLLITGKQESYMLQAVLFGFYQAGLYYLFTGSLLYAGGVLVISALVGYLLAALTVKTKGVAAAVLSGAAVNMILALPFFAGILLR